MISLFSSIFLIGGLTIGTKEIDMAKKLNAIRTCRSRLIKHRESVLMSFKFGNEINIIEKLKIPIKIRTIYIGFTSEIPTEPVINYQYFITDFNMSKYTKLMNYTIQKNELMKFGSQIFDNTFLYSCISKRNLSVYL